MSGLERGGMYVLDNLEGIEDGHRRIDTVGEKEELEIQDHVDRD